MVQYTEKSDAVQPKEPAAINPPSKTDDQLIDEIRDELDSLAKASKAPKNHYRNVGRSLVELQKRGFKGKKKLEEEVCRKVGHDLEYHQAIQLMAIATNKELAKYWDRLLCIGYSPLYRFTVLTKHPEKYKAFQAAHLKGKSPVLLTRSMINNFMPPTPSSPGSSAESEVGEAKIGYEVELLDHAQQADFVAESLTIEKKFHVKLTPSPALEKLRNERDAQTPDVE